MKEKVFLTIDVLAAIVAGIVCELQEIAREGQEHEPANDNAA